ncbi:hypothetical protein D3C73_828940 [compost metagenome]
MDARSISPRTFCGGSALRRRLVNSSHFEIRSNKSRCSSSTPFPSETVRIITPKLAGLIPSTIFLRRLRSLLPLIRLEMETVLEKGTKTTKRPAIERSELRRGPFVEMGSLAICTGTSIFLLKTSEILPALSISFSSFKLLSSFS